MEEGSFPIWKGLFDWSMKFQDGTRPTDYKPSEFTPERRAWLQEALSSYMQDFASRMKEIKKSLEEAAEEAAAHAAEGEGAEAAEAKLEEREQLLEELMDIVSSIDYARDLHKIGGLPPLLDLLRCRYPSLRWRAAEVVATCCSNNPPVQQWFSEGGVLPPLMQLMEDTDGTCRTKALLALSALIRHYSPGLAAFRSAGGLGKLVDMCRDGDVRVQRKALMLLQYVLVRSRTSAGPEACALGIVPPLCRMLGAEPSSSSGSAEGGAVAGTLPPSSSGAAESGADAARVAEQQGDSELRQAVLSVLLELARSPSTWHNVHEVSTLPAALSTLLQRHQSLSADDQEAQREEQELVSELQLLLAQGPPEPAAGSQQQQQVEGEEESDHVAVDLTEPNLRDAAKADAAKAAAQQQQQQQQASSLSLSPGGGAMMLAPKVDLF